MLRIEFYLSQDHIDRGARDDCLLCPYALALCGACKDFTGVRFGAVGVCHATIYADGKTLVASLPRDICDEIRQFDRPGICFGCAMKPRDVVLDFYEVPRSAPAKTSLEMHNERCAILRAHPEL